MNINFFDIDDDEIRLIKPKVDQSKAESSRKPKDSEHINMMNYSIARPIHSDVDELSSMMSEDSECDAIDEVEFKSCKNTTRDKKSPKKRRLLYALFAIIDLALIATVVLLIINSGHNDEPEVVEEKLYTLSDGNVTTGEEAVKNSDASGTIGDDNVIPVVTDTTAVAPPAVSRYTTRQDTIINNIKLTILTPHGATPTLVVGRNVFADSTLILATQAADIRRDNGGIVCAFVVKGELMSKGEAKAGYCAIINGEITIGVADTTPMLEEALMKDGYFFRQYPLVAGGQLIENKPKGAALRKALADIDGKICIVTSNTKLTMHDFSQVLIDAGARNAIYLVGSYTPIMYKDESETTYSIWHPLENISENVNFIVWR